MKKPPSLPLRESPARNIPWFGMVIFLSFGILGTPFMVFFSCLFVRSGGPDSVEPISLFSLAPWASIVAGSVPLFTGIVGFVYGLAKRPFRYWWKAILSIFLAYIAGIGIVIAVAARVSF